MKPADVTNEMVADTCEAVGSFAWDCINRSEIIAASVNAVLGDPTPITGAGLQAMWYVCDGKENPSYSRMTPESDVYVIFFGDGFQVFVNGRGVPTKTIGQLRALEIGLGITPCP